MPTVRVTQSYFKPQIATVNQKKSSRALSKSIHQDLNTSISSHDQSRPTVQHNEQSHTGNLNRDNLIVVQDQERQNLQEIGKAQGSSTNRDDQHFNLSQAVSNQKNSDAGGYNKFNLRSQMNRSFDNVSARHRFKKDNTLIRSLYSNICKLDNKFSTRNGSNSPEGTQEQFDPEKSEFYNTSRMILNNNFKIDSNQSEDQELQKFQKLQVMLQNFKKQEQKQQVIKQDPALISRMQLENQKEILNNQPYFGKKSKLSVLQTIQRKTFQHFLELYKVEDQYWNPPPRESATLVSLNHRQYLIGGLNFEASRDISQLKVINEHVQWAKFDYESKERLEGRLQHTALTYQDKILIFGGSYPYNKKRQQRECISQVVVFDPFSKVMNVLKTSGISIQPRRAHCAAIFKKNMIVYGGYLDNGTISDEMLSLDLSDNTWQRVQPLKQIEGLAQAASVTDDSKDGIYVFGGINKKGELSNKLRQLKIQTIDGIVKYAEWHTITPKSENQPVSRIGHALLFLPVTNALILIGGRNDELAKQNQSPFLNDIHLYLLELNSWVELKYTHSSHRMERLSNHAVAIECNSDFTQEKILIFGGVSSKQIPILDTQKSSLIHGQDEKKLEFVTGQHQEY
eukprot:403370405